MIVKSDEEKRLMLLKFLKDEYPSNIFDLIAIAKDGLYIYYDLYVFNRKVNRITLFKIEATAPSWGETEDVGPFRWIRSQDVLRHLFII